MQRLCNILIISFLNGVRLYIWDNNKPKLVAHRTFDCYFLSELTKFSQALVSETMNKLNENWDLAQEFMERMMSISQEMTGNGLDSASFRKFKFRHALLSEKFYGQPNADGLVKLIAENPHYNPYHTVLRGILRQYADRVNVKMTEDNPLLKAIIDPEVDEDSFMALLEENRSGKTEEWTCYRKSLSRLNFK